MVKFTLYSTLIVYIMSKFLSKPVLSLLIWNGEKESFCKIFKLYDNQTLSKNSSLLLQKNRNNRLPQFFPVSLDVNLCG